MISNKIPFTKIKNNTHQTVIPQCNIKHIRIKIHSLLCVCRVGEENDGGKWGQGDSTQEGSGM